MKRQLLTLALVAASLGLMTGCSGNSGSKKLTIVHFDQSILGETQKDLGVSIGIKKGNTELQNDLNNALATIDETTRAKWMEEAIARAEGDLSSTTSTVYTVPTDATKTLVVGLECDYAPFNWTEVKATTYSYPIKGSSQYADGYDIQMARYLAHEMNYKLEIVKLGWDALIPALENGTINAVIAGMTDTEERRKSIDFSNEYYRSELVLVVKEDSKYASATSLADFAGAKFVSQVSTVTDDVIDAWKSEFNVVHLNALDTFATCALAVQNGTADVMTAELPVANAIVNGSR